MLSRTDSLSSDNEFDMDKCRRAEIAKNDVAAQEQAKNLADVIIIGICSTGAWVMPSSATTGTSRSNINMGEKPRGL